jgi:hypothetical protein
MNTLFNNLNRMNHHYFCVHPTEVMIGAYTVHSKSGMFYLVKPEIALSNLSSGIEVTDFYRASGKINVSNEFVIPVTHGFNAEDKKKAKFFADIIKDGRIYWMKYFATSETEGEFFYDFGGLVNDSTSGQRLWSNLLLAELIRNSFCDRIITTQKELDALI